MRAAWLATLAIAASTLLAPPADAARASRVVVSTDVGATIDDPWTLAHLALMPGLELAGVLTTHAPNLEYPPARTAAKHAMEVLAAVGRSEVPVVAGLNAAFGDEQDIKPGPAADFLIEASRGHTRDWPLRVVCLGPVTDVALALVVEPSLADRIEVVAMGFDGWPKGGDGWNVKHDPLAWRLLLQSRAPLVVGDAAVTKRDLMFTRDRAHALAAGRGRAGAYLVRLYDAGLGRDPQHPTGPLWDHVTLAWLLGHAKAETRPRPQMGLDMALVHGGKGNQPAVRWITEVDAAPVWRSLSEALDRRAAAER